MHYVENKTFSEIQIGDCAEITRVLTKRDIDLFAVASGDVNPSHVDVDYANGTAASDVVGHGMWAGAVISAVLGNHLPGPGTVYVAQSLDFDAPVFPGDRITARVEVTRKDDSTGQITLACTCRKSDGAMVAHGEAIVRAPMDKIRRRRTDLPEIQMHAHHAGFDEMLERTETLDPIPTAVVHPVDENALSGALEAGRRGLITPILVGPEAKIRAAAEAGGHDIRGLDIIATDHSHAAAQTAVGLVREGKVEALMKGALHTDEIMGEVVHKTRGLRTERRMSHVFVLDVPSYPKPLLISDAAINIFPDLETKADIVQNAIELGQALGVDVPKVAILSAVETIYPKIPSTVEAAALCKMADRGQITGGRLDGPLAFDNAISLDAARTKGIASDVAGDADILIAPDLEAGNMIAKQLMYLAGAESAGLVLGARVPVMLTSRADGMVARVASAALAQLLVHYRKTRGLV